jgi:uncharacterized protein YegP (UPF0339 family)
MKHLFRFHEAELSYFQTSIFSFKKHDCTMGKFVISQRTNGEWQFSLKATNGQTILSSEGYNNRASCDNGVESVRKNASEDARYERKTSSNGKFFFNLKATNGQVIGSSQMYETEESRDSGIESVKNNAPDATVTDDSTQ